MGKWTRVSGVEWKFSASPILTTLIMKCRNLPSEESHVLHLTQFHFLTVSDSTPCSERRYKFIFGMRLSRLQYELLKDIVVSKSRKRNKSFSERRHGSAERSCSNCLLIWGFIGPAILPGGAARAQHWIVSVLWNPTQTLSLCLTSFSHPQFWSLPPTKNPELPLFGWPTWDDYSYNKLISIHDSWLLMSHSFVVSHPFLRIQGPLATSPRPAGAKNASLTS